MKNNTPERGIDFDDFIGTTYFEKSLKMKNPKMTPVYCAANDRHDDDFIGIMLTGYADSDKGSIQVSKIIYPTKNFTEEDRKRFFEEVELEDGTVKYRTLPTAALDEVYIRVCYSQNPEKEDTIKWVSAVHGGEVFALHGNRRQYQPKDAEA